MISSAPVLPVLLNNKKNRCNLIFYSNVLKMKDFQITSICFPAWETSASMELNSFLRDRGDFNIFIPPFGRSPYTSPFLKRLTIIWMKDENIQTSSASSLDSKRLKSVFCCFWSREWKRISKKITVLWPALNEWETDRSSGQKTFRGTCKIQRLFALPSNNASSFRTPLNNSATTETQMDWLFSWGNVTHCGSWRKDDRGERFQIKLVKTNQTKEWPRNRWYNGTIPRFISYNCW